MPTRAPAAVPRPAIAILLSSIAALVLLACQKSNPPHPAPLPQRQRDTVTIRDPELEQRAARLQWRLLEKEAEVEGLQSQLDEAQREVVRVMARLQTLATRAEAAAAIAEAEVAVQPLTATGTPGADVTHTKRLLGMAGVEFNRQNFGGAVYLASQAKRLAAESRPDAGSGDARPGEVRFAVPLRLAALQQSNVREGPGTNFKVAFTIERGMTLNGMGYVSEWVRVADLTGRTGWVRQDLVGPRPKEP